MEVYSHEYSCPSYHQTHDPCDESETNHGSYSGSKTAESESLQVPNDDGWNASRELSAPPGCFLHSNRLDNHLRIQARQRSPGYFKEISSQQARRDARKRTNDCWIYGHTSVFDIPCSVHTLTCCTHIFLRTARSLRTSHIFMRVHIHAWLKGAKKSFLWKRVVSLHLAFSLLVPHPSLLFPHGHFETTRSCRTCLSLKRRTCATPHMHRKVWLPGQVRCKHRLWAKEVRQEYFRGWWHDTHQWSGPQHLLLIENHEREHQTTRWSHNVWIPCFARFSWWFCSSDRKQRKHAIGKPLLDIEREEREGFVISVAESMSKKDQRNGISVSLKSHRESCSEVRKFHSDGWDRREHFQRTARQATIAENFDSRKFFLNESNWRSRNQSEEMPNTHWLRRDESLNHKDENCWKPINGQIELNVREYTCVVNWRWRTVFTKNALQEVAKKLKISRRPCYQQKISIKKKT